MADVPAEHILHPHRAITTSQAAWRPLRFEITDAAKDTALATGTNAADFGDKPRAAPVDSLTSSDYQATAAADPVSVKIPIYANAVEVLFYGSDTANDYATYYLYGWAVNGPVMLIGTGVMTLGAADCVEDPVTGITYPSTGLYADTITETSDAWNGVSLIDAAGADRIARLAFDARGIQWLAMYFTDIDTTGGMVTASAAYRVF